MAHRVKHDGHGFYYPIQCGTEKRTKNTSADIRTRVDLQTITAGRPKGKRTKRYTTCIAWRGTRVDWSRSTRRDDK